MHNNYEHQLTVILAGHALAFLRPLKVDTIMITLRQLATIQLRHYYYYYYYYYCVREIATYIH